MLKPGHSLFLLFAFLYLFFGALALTSDSEDEDKCGDDETCVSSVNEGSAEFHSTNFRDIKKAWFAAATLPDRDPEFIRVDRFGNIILGRNFSKNSHLSWIALYDEESEEFFAVQKEYYGKGEADNHENALKYNLKDRIQESFLDLLEIGLRGHLADSTSVPSCWTPSEVHQSLMRFDVGAVYWHEQLFTKDKRFGMHGHNTIFQPMEVFLKRNTLTEQMLRSSNPLKTLMVVYNNKPQCSAILDTFDAPENSDKVQKDMKHNWGLPRVPSFVKRPTSAELNARAKVVKPTKKIISKATPAPSVAGPASYKRAVTTPQNKLSPSFDDDFPALGTVSKKK